MNMRVTAMCPVAMREDANHLAMCLAAGPADGNTYRTPLWQDGAGNTYAVTSFPTSQEWITAALTLVERPAWDVEPYAVNLTGARRAQAAMVVWSGGDAILAALNKLVVYIHPDPHAALAMAGLTPVPVDDV